MQPIVFPWTLHLLLRWCLPISVPYVRDAHTCPEPFFLLPPVPSLFSHFSPHLSIPLCPFLPSPFLSSFCLFFLDFKEGEKNSFLSGLCHFLSSFAPSTYCSGRFIKTSLTGIPLPENWKVLSTPERSLRCREYCLGKHWQCSGYEHGTRWPGSPSLRLPTNKVGIT